MHNDVQIAFASSNKFDLFLGAGLVTLPDKYGHQGNAIRVGNPRELRKIRGNPRFKEAPQSFAQLSDELMA